MRYLLLFFSTLLLLFTLSQAGGSVNSYRGAEQTKLKKTCQMKRNLKHTCVKKCLKHQTQQEQQNGSGLTTDCSQQVFALVDALQAEKHFTFCSAPASTPAGTQKTLSPDLEIDPEPPRFS